MQALLKAPPLYHLTADNLSLKIADSAAEIEAAQRLRYDVFYTEMGAHPTDEMAAMGRDYDLYDPLCQHLLVLDTSLPPEQQVIGTYRMLLLEDALRANVPLYTETEFDLSKLKAKGGRIMEMSRSCVAASHRTKIVINLLWKGIAQCVFSNQIDYLVGVPSFHGTDITVEHDTLAYLNAYHLAPEAIRPRVLEQHYHALPQVAKESINERAAFMKLPPLIKGYLRIGCVIGDGAFIDRQFNTIDIVVILPIAETKDNYFNHYKRHDVDA